MATRMPPTPPQGRSPHDQNTSGNPHDGAAPKDEAEEAKVSGHDKNDRNLKEQGHQGNIAQNTRNHGHQQDR